MTMKIIDKLLENIAERVARKVKKDLVREMAWDVFSTLGIAELEEVLKQAKENAKTDGHNNYTNLGIVFEERLRGHSIERLKQVLSRLTDEPLVSIRKESPKK